MNNRWALAFPVTSLPKSSSESDRVTIRFGTLVCQFGRDKTCFALDCGTGERGNEGITGWLVSNTAADGALLLQINMPTLGLAGFVL